jgi:threonine/homoserine/homoserine lactone efflux protein
MSLFLASAVALLGSPGPGITALVAVGRVEGLSKGLRYFAGLQVGLAAGAAACATGLASLLKVWPSSLRAMTIVATIYLVFLAYRIATARVGSSQRPQYKPSSAKAGLLLGITNPKLYVAVASLLASHTLLPGNPGGDTLLKWTLCVIVIIVVDLIWLLAGVALNHLAFQPRVERILNVTLGATILAAAAGDFPW